MNNISNIESDDEFEKDGVSGIEFGRTVQSEYLNSSQLTGR